MKPATIVSTGLVMMTVAIAGVSAQQKTVDPRILEYDKGPDTIDVSAYPEEMQQRYTVFDRKCQNCHTLARAINSDFVLEDEWERYVKRMMRRAGNFISKKNGRDIFDFVVYDSKIRKKELYEEKTRALADTLSR
jgi:hypothetical protein